MEQLYPERVPIADPHSIYDDLELPAAMPGRPFVALNMVSTVDGKITLDRSERAVPLGSPVDRELMKRLRVHFDAVLRGAETVRANPYFPGVSAEEEGRRQAAGRERQPLAVVASGSLELPFDSSFFTRGPSPPVILTIGSAPAERRAVAARRARVEVVGEEQVEPRLALKVLYEKYGVRRLLLEGGAALNFWFAQEGLIDVYFWTLAPKISGFSQDLTMIEGPRLIRPVPRLRLETLHHHEGELYFRWASLPDRPPSPAGG